MGDKVFLAEDYFSRYKEIIPDYLNFLLTLKKPLPQYFRINNLKVWDREALFRSLKENYGLIFEEVKELSLFYRVTNNEEISLGNLEEYSLGLIHSMTVTSGLPVIALDPKPEELILDLCAAPGGKTALLAMLTEDQAIIVANDKRIDRLTALVANIKRLGITCVITTCYRGEFFPLGIPFQKVLVDAPCSGEGRYRVGLEGEILYQKVGKSNLPSIQKGLLIRAFDLVQPGGIIVYSTCTINPEENEAVVDYLLRKRPAEIVDWVSPLPYSEGLTEWKEKEFHPKLKLTKRFYTHQVKAVGFYIAKIKKLI
ncbi:MAG: RsmB/NOP family class I SAM-dependent RNA methyltransferase [Thermodesulfobacteriaceae bacterium]|nr:RsmB/NOP family class I SAM-dependent RNA methyltransferase [Thermodesulfobacteriaceae bacterium]MDW8136137.1 RsmB/NOP family class I SAM-dependent RNA methyltransferase [Thermodesulfobacterium sp.]